MSGKTKKVLSFIFILLPSLMVIFSGVLKLVGSEMIVTTMTKVGFGPYIKLLGVAELIFVALVLIPKTYKVGFFFLLSYLGGAAAIEIGGGGFSTALVLIALLWIGVYLKGDRAFVGADKK